MNIENFNLNTLQAGDCGSDSCGCYTHTDTLQAGDCGSDSCGCSSHNEILMA